MQGLDGLALCSEVRVPTLVISCTGDIRIPSDQLDMPVTFEQGAKIAAAIPGARFVPLESVNHVLLQGEPAWIIFHLELAAFLGDVPSPLPFSRKTGLTRAEADVLSLLAQGLDNRSIARSLGKSEKTVRNQVSVVLSKLGVQSRAQAIILALGT